jgi:hypothetical protein
MEQGMITIDFWGISFEADYTRYSDGDITLDDLRTIDHKGNVICDFPSKMFTIKAEEEIITLIAEALDQRKADYDKGLI